MTNPFKSIRARWTALPSYDRDFIQIAIAALSFLAGLIVTIIITAPAGGF